MMKFLGVKRFAKKDGSGFCHMVEFAGPFCDREIQAGSVGLKCQESFISQDLFDRIAPAAVANVGKECEFSFVMNSSGRADICDIKFLDK